MLMLEIGDKNYIFKLVLSLMNLIFMTLCILVKSHQMRAASRRIKIKNKKINKSFIPHIQALNLFQIHHLLYHHLILVIIILNYKLINTFIMGYAIMISKILLFIEINNKSAKFFAKKVIKFRLYFHLFNKKMTLLQSLYSHLTQRLQKIW
jgi:hypothetical protein